MDGSHELLLAINAQLATLIGKVGGLEAQMDESIRQRRTQFTRLDSLDGRVNELIATVHAHAENEEQVIDRLHHGVETLEGRVDRAEETLVRMEGRRAEEPNPPATPSTRRVIALGGTGLITLFFGEDVVSGVSKFAEGVAKAWHKLH